MSRAICRVDPDARQLDWFAQRGTASWADVLRTIAACKAACERCPIKADCLSDALGEQGRDVSAYGIRGGMTARERANMLSARKRDAAHA